LTAAADAYRIRFRKVLEHIDARLDGDLSVERLSSVAAFSKYHFHRQFSELFGIGVHKYVHLVRLKRASYQLAFRDGIGIASRAGAGTILDVALASGYESHEAFSRAFKKAFGQTPSEFRDQPQWAPWHALYQPLIHLRIAHMTPDYRAEHVKIVNFEETRVAVLEHRGDPARLEDSVRKFIEWRKLVRLPPKASATFNLLYDDPAETPPEDFRFDLCAATDRDVAGNAFGVVAKTIPGGRCAVLRHTGSDDTLGEAVRYLYATWLPASGQELREFPLYLQRIRFFPDVPEHEAVTDVFLPLASRPNGVAP
jgi:AraC family transcriptional regulator